MKYRVVQYRNGKFGVQHKLLFTWWNETPAEDVPAIVTFETYQKAKEYMDTKHRGKGFKVVRFFKDTEYDENKRLRLVKAKEKRKNMTQEQMDNNQDRNIRLLTKEKNNEG